MNLISIETLAVILAITYLLLAARENIWCWLCAFFSSGIYVVVFWDVSLLMESLLNIFYVVMAVVGWYSWRFGGKQHHGVPIRVLSPMLHLFILIGIVLLSGVFGWWMKTNTAAAWPFLDSFTTCASVVTTFMVVWKILENWIYWFLIDSISIYLYLDRGLYLTALLFTAYVVIVVLGFMHWYKHWKQNQLLAS